MSEQEQSPDADASSRRFIACGPDGITVHSSVEDVPLNARFWCDAEDDFVDDVEGEDDEDCAFCMGREAAYQGEPDTANPYVQTDAEVGSDEWYDSDFALWRIGHGIGVNEATGSPAVGDTDR